MLDSGKCRCSRHVTLFSSCLLYFMYLPNHSSASGRALQLQQSCHFAHELHILSLVQQRGSLQIKDRRKEVPHTDCRRSEQRQRPRYLVVQQHASSPLATWTIGSQSTLLAPRPVMMKIWCIRQAFCGGVDWRMALVCSNLLVEISCADIAVAWSLSLTCAARADHTHPFTHFAG